jgi:hypothetical protein
VSLYHLITDYQPGAVVMAAAEIGLLDRLRSGPADLHGLSAQLGVSARGLDAIVRALQVMDIVDADADSVALRHEAAELVRTGAGGLARLIRKEHGFHKLWGDLAGYVRRGQGHFPSWRTRGFDDPATTSFFLQALNDIAATGAPGVLAAAGLDEARSILDVGGGGGGYARAILERVPDVTVTILELAATAPITRELTAGVERLRVVEGDAATEGLGCGIAPGAGSPFDAAFVSHLLHDLDPGECRAVLGHVARSVQPGAPVVVVDTVSADVPDDRTLALFDVMMIVETPAGRVHRRAEVLDWLTEAGIVDVVETRLFFGSVFRGIARP